MPIVKGMHSDDFDIPEFWDEFQWERYLQELDQRTENYFKLAHRSTDAMEAIENISIQNESQDVENPPLFFSLQDCLLEDYQDCEEYDVFEKSLLDNPLYPTIEKLHLWVEKWLESIPKEKEETLVLCLATLITILNSKISTALSLNLEEDMELGMMIAYLKRGLKSANDALDSELELFKQGSLTQKEHEEVTDLIFLLRNQVVDMMKECRREWIRRYGKTQ